MRTLGIVPARGGSKGIERKNLRLLGKQPLLVYTAEAARAARRIDRVILTTEDDEIASVGRWAGLDVPFLRPKELAEDTTAMLPVIQHAVGWLEERGDRYDAICLLQPTTPFRESHEIDACVDLLERSGADSVVSVLAVPAEYNPNWVYFADEAGELSISTGATEPITRRQDLPTAYHRDGSVYVVRRDTLMVEGSLFGKRLVGYVTEPEGHVNLDTMRDWERAEQILKAKRVGAV